MSKTPVENAPQAPAAETLEQRFRRLEAAWEAETQFLSDPQRIIEHPAFQEIIGLGMDVVPPMLKDLERGPCLWVWALPRITGENPVSPAYGGNIQKMGEAWLRWGREKGCQ
jgi:hypothetical protein